MSSYPLRLSLCQFAPVTVTWPDVSLYQSYLCPSHFAELWGSVPVCAWAWVRSSLSLLCVLWPNALIPTFWHRITMACLTQSTPLCFWPVLMQNTKELSPTLLLIRRHMDLSHNNCRCDRCPSLLPHWISTVWKLLHTFDLCWVYLVMKPYQIRTTARQKDRCSNTNGLRIRFLRYECEELTLFTFLALCLAAALLITMCLGIVEMNAAAVSQRRGQARVCRKKNLPNSAYAFCCIFPPFRVSLALPAI